MVYLIFLIPLLIAVYTDTKTMTIPIWLFPSSTLAVGFLLYYQHNLDRGNFMGLIFLGIITFAMAITGILGGADVIMFAAIGFIMSYDTLTYLVILTLICTIFWIFNNNAKKEYPMAPFILTAYILTLAWNIITP